MQRSKVEVFFHLVWATRGREPLLEPEIERLVHRCMAQEVERLNCKVLALNGMPDHVHLVVQMHSTVSAARLAQAVKGVSSRMMNEEQQWNGAFDWQDHYAVFSVSRSHLKRVVSYVQHQKMRHAKNQLWPEWEQTHIELEPET